MICGWLELKSTRILGSIFDDNFHLMRNSDKSKTFNQEYNQSKIFLKFSMFNVLNIKISNLEYIWIFKVRIYLQEKILK